MYTAAILNIHHYPGKSTVHQFADLTLKPAHIAGNGKIFVYAPNRDDFYLAHQRDYSKLTRFVIRVICGLAAVLLFPLTLLGCTIKLLYSEQEKINRLVVPVLPSPVLPVHTPAPVERKNPTPPSTPPQVQSPHPITPPPKVEPIEPKKSAPPPPPPPIIEEEIEEEMAVEDLEFDWQNNPKVFSRSRDSFNHMAQGLEGFDLKEPTILNIKGTKHQIIYTGVHHFADQPLASVGTTSRREILILDPKKSPILERSYQELVSKLRKKQTEKGRALTTREVIKQLYGHVQQDLFPRQGAASTRALIAAYFENPDTLKLKFHPPHTNIGRQFPVISLDQILIQRCGCCRHHGLTNCFLLSRLVKDGFLRGTVYHIRDNVPRGAHTWAVFIPERRAGMAEEKWHLDTLWQVRINFAKPKNLEFLKKPYGEQAINNQIAKITESIEEGTAS